MMSDAYSMQAEIANGAPWDMDENAGSGKDSTSLEKQCIGDIDSRRVSALWHMRNVKTPVLILHGENDLRVPLEQAITFYRACIRKSMPVDIVTYPRGGYFASERRHPIDMWERVRKL
ncbi:Alpha/Beta hydrolase protein [Penicillium coprophilum]|uniref:Alpha/Beta hydrolase protein n=1 Tax=Penicillium coprophilum TaxID=36646 RepID=UPI0023924C2B|nr:Alpha/Beta hydrolase protein [Penicillium coprophilum]KAJ5170128.1 Alpha/Beta hydrolase protein [Penicillium coprophilum]